MRARIKIEEAFKEMRFCKGKHSTLDGRPESVLQSPCARCESPNVEAGSDEPTKEPLLQMAMKITLIQPFPVALSLAASLPLLTSDTQGDYYVKAAIRWRIHVSPNRDLRTLHATCHQLRSHSDITGDRVRPERSHIERKSMLRRGYRERSLNRFRMNSGALRTMRLLLYSRRANQRK